MNVVGDRIRDGIISEVKDAKFYSIIADEVTDVKNKEEVTLVVCYLCNGEVKEVFVDFIDVERITGKILGESILQWLTSHNISPADMCRQCY